jgi:hypothetical protein
MSKFSNYKLLYDNLYNALEQATTDEFQHLEYVTIGGYTNEEKEKIMALSHVALLELREYMDQLISLFNIEPPMSFLGKRISNFADAAYIVNNCRIQLISKMSQQDTPECDRVINNIVNCCNELSSIAAVLN